MAAMAWAAWMSRSMGGAPREDLADGPLPEHHAAQLTHVLGESTSDDVMVALLALYLLGCALGS
jgi:hypothetical protein